MSFAITDGAINEQGRAFVSRGRMRLEYPPSTPSTERAVRRLTVVDGSRFVDANFADGSYRLGTFTSPPVALSFLDPANGHFGGTVDRSGESSIVRSKDGRDYIEVSNATGYVTAVHVGSKTLTLADTKVSDRTGDDDFEIPEDPSVGILESMRRDGSNPPFPLTP